MAPETQQKILSVLYRLMTALCTAMGFENCRYEELIQFLRAGVREYGSAIPSLALQWAKAVIPEGSDDRSIKPENFEAYLAQIETQEKAEALLLSLPEPDPRWLDLTLKNVKAELPRLRAILLPFAKQLPHPPGGRPKKLLDPAKRQGIREEIGSLLAKSVSLKRAQERIAIRNGVSLRTIQRIWQEKTDR